MINLCKTIQCPYSTGKKCDQYKSPKSCHLERYIKFDEYAKFIFVEELKPDFLEVMKYYNELYFSGKAPLQQWFVLDDRFVYDRVKGTFIETCDVFTNEVLDSRNVQKLIPSAIDLSDVILDFTFNNDGGIITEYSLGRITVRLQAGNSTKIYFSEIGNYEILHDVCILTCDLLRAEYQDNLELGYFEIRI